jgi:uncharacterized protein (TIGR03085 family)
MEHVPPAGIRAGIADVTSHSAAERAALADALTDAGPDAPTLCAGWTTRDLAAHLVVRERRIDSMPGIVVPPLAGWTERVRRGYAQRPYPDLVAAVRNGPARLSWASLPKLDALVNVGEHFVHCEDVRRGAPGWTPRQLPPERQEALWRMVTTRGRLFFRRSPVGVTLADPGGRTARVLDREPTVVVRGEPAELVLFAFGRGRHALVDLDGPDDAVTRLAATELGV